MKLLINASTLSGSGVTQVAVSFITECKKRKCNEYFVFVSCAVYNNLKIDSFPENFHFYLFKKHPFYGINGCICRFRLSKLERLINPDCTFSVFGPSYWTPKSPHLMGYAYPHYVYSESPLFKRLCKLEIMKIWFYKLLHKYYLRKNGAYYVCETKDVSMRLKSYLEISERQIFTVGNTCNHSFEDYQPNLQSFLPIQRHASEFRFLSLCSPYLHKNLSVLNEVIPILKEKFSTFRIKFVLSISNGACQSLFHDKFSDYIVNIGSIKISDCPQLYSECDALFLPTLLECFSANYPEAMFMHKPILTSNLPFATSVCGNAALYFDPLNAVDITNKIIQIVTDIDLYNNLIEKGDERFKTFPSAEERAFSYLEICNQISLISKRHA